MLAGTFLVRASLQEKTGHWSRQNAGLTHTAASDLRDAAWEHELLLQLQLLRRDGHPAQGSRWQALPAIPLSKIKVQQQSCLQQTIDARVRPVKQRCSSQQVLSLLLQVLLDKLLVYRMNHPMKHSSDKNVKLLYGAKMTINNEEGFVWIFWCVAAFFFFF